MHFSEVSSLGKHLLATFSSIKGSRIIWYPMYVGKYDQTWLRIAELFFMMHNLNWKKNLEIRYLPEGDLRNSLITVYKNLSLFLIREKIFLMLVYFAQTKAQFNQQHQVSKSCIKYGRKMVHEN